jgi:predicted O-linked N-acetylglucosamine transferase (SPINDLY family)
MTLMAFDAALAGFEAALAADPHHVESLFFKGETLINLGRLDEARACLDAALAIDPERADILDRRLTVNKQLVDWDRVAADLAQMIALGDKRGSVGPFALLSAVDDPALHKQCAQLHSAVIGTSVGPVARLPAHPAGDRLRVGYFSADFHGDATMHLIAEMLEAHDRDRFAITLFSFGAPMGDAWQARARGAADRFLDLRFQSEAEIAAAARDLQIDIAIDLKGDTGHSRQGIFAHRAAPLQAHYLGYPGTMGADWFDYIIVDPIVAPDAARDDFSERRLVLPDCYQPNCRTRDISRHKISRGDFGLPDTMVFASFNQGYKITEAVFDVWMSILGDVPDSVLWLWVEIDPARQRLRQAAAARGIDPARLVFAGPLPPHDHLNRLQLADLFLDTAPYGAHTTASDALRMGLPVVTCTGRSFAARVATSLLHAVGMAELATADWPAYRALATDLAGTRCGSPTSGRGWRRICRHRRCSIRCGLSAISNRDSSRSTPGTARACHPPTSTFDPGAVRHGAASLMDIQGHRQQYL